MELDIEKIMDEIRQEIKDKRETTEILSFEEIPFESASVNTEDKFSLNVLNENVNISNERYLIQAYRPLNGNPLFIFIKKVIRKLIKFYIEPIVNDQNNFNVSILRSMNAVRSFINENNYDSERVKELEKSLKLMEIKINELQKKVDGLK